ncbi:MAG: hypothetical protein GXY08_00375 [Ruminococcus sp.]|nr:hypothetical protein [Ruminococcus sp.]
MKDFKNAFRIYLKISLRPFLFITALILLFGFNIAFFISPPEKGTSDYGAMLGSVFVNRVGLMIMGINAGIIMSRNKYFASLPTAKQLFTVVPVVYMTILCLFYDIITNILIYIRTDTEVLSDVLIFSAAGSMMACLAVAVSGKKRYTPLSIGVIFSWMAVMFVGNHDSMKNGFELPLQAALLLFVAIYVFSMILSLTLLKKWWKISNRSEKGDSLSLAQV